MHVDRPLHVGVRLRHVHPTPIVSAPQQRLAFAWTTLERESRQITRLLLRVAEEDEGGATAMHVCSHESRRRTFAVWQALRLRVSCSKLSMYRGQSWGGFLFVLVCSGRRTGGL